MSTALTVSKRLYRKCPRGIAKIVLPWLLPTACFSPIAFWKSMCKETACFHDYLLIIGGAIKFISPTFSSLEHLLLIPPTHDLNLGWGIQALLFLISSLIFAPYSLAAEKISYLTMLDLLGKECFCGSATLHVYVVGWAFCLFLF